jgi:hypothetical protein
LVVFLSETKMNSKAIDRLKWSLGFRHGVAVDSKEKSGDLALLWRDRVEVTVRPWCQYYIDAKIKWGDTEWRFTGIYGEPRKELRQKTWDVLRYLRGQDSLPWLYAGDYNEIIRSDEQVGGNAQSAAQMERFRGCLADYGLADLGFSGYKFTWNNRRDGQDNVQARLDRATCDASFSEMFPAMVVEHITTEESDHLALLIRVQSAFPSHSSPNPRGFRYEEMWTRHDDYSAMVENAWEQENQGGAELGGCGTELKEFQVACKGGVGPFLARFRRRSDG